MPIPSDHLGSDELVVLELLVLRHLYDGDVIEWPLPDDHPERRLFDTLEQRGWIARWDRVWPLRDRYRLTAAGIAEIERHYRPGESQAAWERLQQRSPTADERLTWLLEHRLDPVVWPALHDAYTHWESFRVDRGPNDRATRVAREERAQRRAEAPVWDVVEDLDRSADAPGAFHLPFGDVS